MKKDLDESFKEKLHDFERQPLPDSWASISGKLAEREKETGLRRMRTRYYAYAASLALILTMAGLYWYMQKLNQQQIVVDTVRKPETKPVITEVNPTPEIKATPVAPVLVVRKSGNAKKELRLPDGSRIVLNQNTEIKYQENFTEDRTVYLSGEAFFDVKHNPEHAFKVLTNRSKTEVLGTSFIVRSVEKESYDEVSVSKGKVSFSDLLEKSEGIVILAGNKSIMGSKGPEQQTAIADVNYNAWLTEKIVFNDTELRSVITTLDEYYGISVSVSNPKILNCRFTGVFERSDINEILEVLSVSFNLSYNQESKNYTLSGKGCR